MTLRPFNFSAGPATMPEAVLQQAAADMLSWRGCGMGVMEMSHRGPEFKQIAAEAQADLRRLLAIPAHFKVLFMQGGGIAENAIVPLNLSRGAAADFVITGSWTFKSHAEAQRYCHARVAATNVDAVAPGHRFVPAPSSWQLSRDAAYVHICSNETIDGLEYAELPDLKSLGCDAPLVVDFSSHVASRAVDWSRVGLAFGGAQKNLGPAGLTVVVVREDLIGHALPICPSAFDYATVAKNDSMYNTPPTWAIYVAGLVFKWLLAQTEGHGADAVQGLAAIERRNQAKAQMLYAAIDGSGLYVNHVNRPDRSRMNVPFFLRDKRLQAPFLEGAKAAGLLQLKGHQSVGGMRASLYNALPLAGVQALVGYMTEFERVHG
jgi:phosphoserine aminotransferase